MNLSASFKDGEWVMRAASERVALWNWKGLDFGGCQARMIVKDWPKGVPSRVLDGDTDFLCGVDGYRICMPGRFSSYPLVPG